MGDGGLVLEGPLGDDGDVVSVQGQDPKVLEAGEGRLLDALELVVADNQGRQSGQVAENARWQHCNLIVA